MIMDYDDVKEQKKTSKCHIEHNWLNIEMILINNWWMEVMENKIYGL